MALFDFFKRKKKPEKKKAKKVVKPPEVKKKIEKPKKEKPKKKKEEARVEIEPRPKRVSEIAWQILKEPHISEKTADLVKQNQYVFKVWPRAEKPEIKRAIENLYGVEVKGVRIIKIPRKKRRLGRISGWRKGYKKAIIKVKEGQKIEVLPR